MSYLNDVNSSLNKIHDCLQSFVADTSILNAIATSTFNECNQSLSATTKIGSNTRTSSKRLSIGNITQPNSIVEFQNRLSSFKFGSWTVTGLSPLLCARHGWKLKIPNILQCVTCNALICTSLPPASQYSAHIEFLNLLKKRLKFSHKDWCGWSFNQCPEKYACPPLAFSVHYIEDLQNDIKILSPHCSKLPLMNISEHLIKLNIEKWHLHILHDNNSTLDDEQLSAVLLVLVGWRYEENDYLRCSVCLRKIGLWNYIQIQKKEDYLRLKKRHFEKQKRKEIQEAARRERIEARKAREEVRKLLAEEKLKIQKEEDMKAKEIAEKEAKAEALRSMIREERQKMLEAINYEQLIDQHINDIEEEVDEKEEQVLLGEIDEKFPPNNTSYNSCEIIHHQTNKSDISIDSKGKENTTGEDGLELKANIVGNLNGNEITENLYSDDELSINSNDNNVDYGAKNEDDLWLEAVGCEKVTDKPTSSSDNSEGEREELRECSESPILVTIQQPQCYSDNNSESELLAARKRRRSSDSDSVSSEQASKRRVTKDDSVAKDDCLVNSHTIHEPLEQEISNFKINQATEVQQKNIEESECHQSSESENEVEIEEDTDEDHIYDKMNKSFFDPFEEHRPWCGWLSKFSSSDNDREKLIPGYLILSEQLKNILPQSSRKNGSLLTSESYSNIIEGLRTIRSTLSEWQLEQHEELN